MHRFIAAERGSIPAVLLTSIIVGGLVVILVAAVLVNQRASRFDRSYTAVLQEADEFAQQAAHHLIRGEWDPARDDSIGQTYQITGATTCPPVAPGDVCMTATKTSGLRWEITAEAAARTEADDIVTREVAMELVNRPRFFVAAFADTSMTLRGANASSSYGNGLVNTGNGFVASNNDIMLDGSVTDVDAVQLYNWEAYPVLTRCTHVGGNDCNDVRALPDAALPSARIDKRLEVGGVRLPVDFIDTAIADCEAALPPSASLPSYTSSVNGSVLDSATFPKCVQDLRFDTTVTIAPMSGPIEVYVKGLFSVGNSLRINCPLPCNEASDPDAAMLQIYSAGGDVVIGNQGSIAAGIYAPRSECRGNPSNAQGDIYGSMICDTISNQGGWAFHYDDKLSDVGSGVLEIEDYREE